MVVIIIFLPVSKAKRKSALLFACATIFLTSEKSLILSRICLSNILRSVTTITVSKIGLSKARLPATTALSG